MEIPLTLTLNLVSLGYDRGKRSTEKGKLRMQNGNSPEWQGLDKPAASVNEHPSNDIISPVGEDAVNAMVKAMALFERHKKAAIAAIESDEYDRAEELVADLRTMSSEFRKTLGLKVL